MCRVELVLEIFLLAKLFFFFCLLLFFWHCFHETTRRAVQALIWNNIGWMDW